MRRADVQRADIVPRDIGEAPLVDAAEPVGVARKAGHRDVRPHLHAKREAVLLAILGQVADTRRDGIGRLADRRVASVHDDLARVARFGAEDRARKLGAPRAHEPGETEDLALLHREGNVPEFLAPADAAHFESDFGMVEIGDGHRRVGQFAADHHRDDLRNRCPRRLNRAHTGAIPHHGDAVGDALDLVHLVADVDHADAFVPEPPDDVEEFADLGLVEGGGRLVHDEDAGLEAERLGDFHHLLPGDGQFADRHPRVDMDIHAFEDRPRVGVEPCLVDLPEGQARLASDPDVLPDREVAHQREFLVDDADAEILRRFRRGQGHFLTVEQDAAAIGVIDTGQAFHQRRLARAVFAHQGMDLAGVKVEIDRLQRVDTGKALVDPLHPHQFAHGATP